MFYRQNTYKQGTYEQINGIPGRLIPNWNKDWSIKCFCCSRIAWENHHITYEPNITRKLCVVCHNIITRLNSKYALKNGRKLTNSERYTIFQYFKNTSRKKK